MNLKKLLSAVGLLSVVTPASLSVIACGNNQTDNNVDKIINTIDKITNLKIYINSNDMKTTVFNILNNKTFGLAETLSKNKDVDKRFKKELFNLDTNNVYINKTEKVDDKQVIHVNTTYYFQYNYAKKQNNVFVPVTVINDEKEIIEAMKTVTYTTKVTVDSTIEQLKEKITPDFIKSQLDQDLRLIFNDKLFTLNLIQKDDNTEITNQDLKDKAEITGKIVFNYDTFTNEKTNIKINVDYSDQQIVDAIKTTKFSTNVIINTLATDFIKNNITKQFIKNSLPEKIQKIINLKNLKIKEIKKGNKILSDNDLETIGTFSTTINYQYNTISETTNLEINVITINQAIVDDINNAQYSKKIEKGTKLAEFLNKIDEEFIKEKINEKNQKDFDWDNFKLENIKKGNEALSGSDLDIIGIIHAKIEYKYADIEKIQTTELTINVSGSINKANVSQIQYQNQETTIVKLKEKFTPELILNNNQFKNAINIVIQNETVVSNVSNYQVENLYTDKNDDTSIAHDSDVFEGATLYIKVIGQNQLSGTVMLKLIITD